MATKRQIEEQDRASANRRAEAVGTIIEHAGLQNSDERGAAVGVLQALAEAIDAEAADVRVLRRKGWQSASTALDSAAGTVRAWRDLVIGYTPPAGPRHEPLADIPRNHGAQTPAELEQRLVDAFGPELAPVRHIRTVVEPATLSEANSNDQVYGPLCDAKDGSFTHPGGANCEECHHIYAEQNDGKPYDGPMAHGNTVPTPVEPALPINLKVANTSIERRDEPITPAVATEIREEIERDIESVERAIAEGRGPAGILAGTADTIAAVVSPEDAAVTKAVDTFTRLDVSDASGAFVEVAWSEERLAALPDAAGILAGTFDDGQSIHEGDAVSVELPNGETVAGTARNVVTDGLTMTADLVPLNIVEPTAAQVRPRMTAAQVREHALARARGVEHRSVSQVEGFSDCGTRYALSDLERPAWWNVGGKALHRAVEEINRWAAVPGAAVSPATFADQESLFLKSFDAEIADQCAATPEWSMAMWRAARRGAEHYDWWRVEGPVMVQRWVAWLSRMLADGWTIARVPHSNDPSHPAGPVIEYETRLDVGIPVPNLSIIDLALLHPQQNTLLIVDCKAGASAPRDTFQLGVYGWSLLAAGVAGFTPTPDLSNVRGTYWRARTGETTPEWPVLSMHPWPDVVQRYRDVDTMERQGVYVPNVTAFCGGCGVADLCPAKASP